MVSELLDFFDKSSIQFSFFQFIKSSSLFKINDSKVPLYSFFHDIRDEIFPQINFQCKSFYAYRTVDWKSFWLLCSLNSFLLFSIVCREDCKSSDGNTANSIVSYHRRRLEIFSIRFPFSLPCAFNCCKIWEGNKKGWYFELFHFHFPLHLLFARWGKKKQRKLLGAYRINYRWKNRNISSTISLNKQHPLLLVSRAVCRHRSRVQRCALRQTALWTPEEFSKKYQSCKGEKAAIEWNWHKTDLFSILYFSMEKNLSNEYRMRGEGKADIDNVFLKERHQHRR